jgi:16S rRNA (cytosine1402-N4)-methyltransferase
VKRERDGRDRAHEPVMVDVVVAYLGGRRTVVDMTTGGGGHAEALLDAAVQRVIGVDRDPRAIEAASRRLRSTSGRFVPWLGPFSRFDPGEDVDGVLFDLGVSSMQLDEPARGFSYRRPGPLDMRMGPDADTAMTLVNDLDEAELADVIARYGEERRARSVARAIVRARSRAPIDSTDDLARVVAGAVGRRKGGPHPARRTFQALRIAANRELEELTASLPRAVGFLAPGGRIVVVAYHSLEDRIVKRFLRSDERVRVLTKRPLRPAPDEVANNPRARSARLRAAERLDDAA